MNGHIYMLFCQPTYRYYIGKSRYPFDHPKAHWRDYLNGSGYKYQSIFKAVKKYGADNFTSICLESDIPEDLLNSREKFFIRLLHAREGGYNRTNGGDGLDSKTARENAHKRVVGGTHHFLGEKNPSHERVVGGTHNLLGEKNPSHKRVADGTHNFLGEKNPSHKRVADGTHNLLGDKNPVHKRVADGTHNLLGDKNPVHKRVADGTHNFLGKNPNVIVRLAKAKYKIVYQYAVMIPACFWYALNSVYLHRKLTREGFFDKDIPDTSNAEQEYLL